MPVPAPAQQATGAPAAATPRALNIPPQALDTALTALADQAGLKLLFASQDVAGLRTSGLVGSFAPAEALGRLLAGTGLTYRFTDATTVTLERLPQRSDAGSDAVHLPPVQVQGESAPETAFGPGKGYVAHQSSTGTKTDTPLLETPQSVSVVTRQQMDDQNAQRVSQALRYTTGVVPESLGIMTKLESTNIFSRGFVLDQYLDGLKLLGGSWGIAQIDPYMLDRIEVLRGPASVLYGQANPAGVLNLISKRPPLQPLHEVELEVGNYNTWGGAFDLGGPLDQNGTLLYRITGLARTADTQVDFTKDKRIAIAPSLTWRPTADTSLTLLASYQKDIGGGFYNWVPAYGTVLPNPNGHIPFSFNPGDPNFDKYDRSQYSLGYVFEHRFSDAVKVGQNLRFTHIDTAFDALLAFGFEPDLRTLDRYTWHDREGIDAFTVDNHAQFKFATAGIEHTLLVGLDYQHNFYNQKLGYDFGATPPIDVFNPVYHLPIPTPDFASDVNQYTNQLGIYAQDQIRIDRWSFLIGARQDWADSRYKDSISGDKGSQSDKKFTWRAGLVYLFDNGLAPYASYSTSFTPQIGTDAGGNPFSPTTAEQYEIGVKYQPTGFDSFITAAVFQLTENNVLTTDPNDPSFQIQTGQIRSRGVELEVHANLTDNWNLVASYSFLDNVVTKSNDGNQGKAPAQFPRHMAALWTQYRFDQGALAGLSLGAGVRYNGRSWGDNDNTFRVPAYTLVDAALQYDLGQIGPAFGGWKLKLNATNLFDKKYVASCGGDSFCSLGLRRSVTARLNYTW